MIRTRGQILKEEIERFKELVDFRCNMLNKPKSQRLLATYDNLIITSSNRINLLIDDLDKG